MFCPRKLKLIVFVAATVALAGCGETDSERLGRELKEVDSWTATAEMVAGAYSKSEVPASYAARTFQTLSEQLHQSTERVQKITNSDPQTASTVQRLQQTVSHMSEAAKLNDLHAVVQLATDLQQQRSLLPTIPVTTK